MVPVIGPMLQQFAGPAWEGIKKIGSAIGGLFGGQSKENKHRDATLSGFMGIGDLDAASEKIRELGFAAGVSDADMRALFSTKKIDEFDRLFKKITASIQQFNEKTAASLAEMKEELATPVVIPVTFGMLNAGLGGSNGTDMFSPRNFASFADWSTNWLGRNPGDTHRLNEALGGENPWGGVQTFARGGRVSGSGPQAAIVHGGEFVQTEAMQDNDARLIDEVRSLRRVLERQPVQMRDMLTQALARA
jgi:hypothetical protein